MSDKKGEIDLLPVYLVNGSDALKRETVIRRLRSRIATIGDLAFNSETFRGEVAQGDAIVAACNTLPFASAVRLVQVDDVDKLKKPESEALVSYLASPCETTVLALVASSLAKNTRLHKAVAAFGKTAVIDCAPLKKSELPRMIRAQAIAHGIAMTQGAAEALVDLVGDDTVELDGSLAKIALAHDGGDPVGEGEVRLLVSRTSEMKPWQFVDAFSGRNLGKCLMCLGRMESVSPHALLALCTTRLRELIAARALSARGDALALASVLHMPAWRVKNHAIWSRGFASEELRSALLSARKAERAMKSGADPDDAFLDFVLDVVGKPR